MSVKREHGLSLIEILIAASLFTTVILGISQSVLLMHRYSRANLCKYKAHLIATSFFESLLCDTHPYDLNKNEVSLRDIENPAVVNCFYYDVSEHCTYDGGFYGNFYENMNTYVTSVYDDGNDDLKVFMLLDVEESPLCKVYRCGKVDDEIADSVARCDIIPPEGFQSLRLSYWYTSPFMDGDGTEGSVSYLAGLECDELYAIRPLNPDDPEYDV